MPYTLLITTFEGGGNVPAVMGAAKELIAAGHRAVVLTEPCLKAPFENVGAEVILFKEYFIRQNRQEDLIRDAGAKPWELPVFDNVIVGPIDGVIKETLQAIDQIKPDAVIADCLMTGSLFAAEQRQLPRIVLFHMPEYLPGPNRPPGGFGLSAGTSWLGKKRDALLGRLFLHKTGQYLPKLNEARVQLGLTPIDDFSQVYHGADLRLIQSARAFDLAIEPAPANVRYTGPILDDPDWVVPFVSPFKGDKPLVLVSLSSTFQNQAKSIQNILTALGNLPVNVLVTLGPAMQNQHFEYKENVLLLASVPHTQILPLAQLVICHAGHGTLIKALSFGVPVLTLPMGRDQNDNAKRATEHGAGLKLSPNASVTAISKAVKKLLQDSSYTNNARRLAQAMKNERRAESLTREVEHLLG